MSDRPTPETDAKASPHIGFYSCATVPANFSRALEQERDEARELLKKALVRGDLALAETKKAKENLFWSDHQDKREMQRERDEAREVIRQIWQSGDAFLPYIDEETTNRWRKAAGLEETK